MQVKKFLLAQIAILTLIILAQITLQAQESPLLEFNEGRIKHQKSAMLVLGSWAVGNIALGSILQGSAQGETKYFHQMNAGWNLVNLGIAAAGYFAIARTDLSQLDLAGSLSEYHRFQKLLLFNGGLDLAYVAGGFYMIERSKRPGTNRPERLAGFGKSIILQGAFLFAFDLTAYFTSLKFGKTLSPSLQIAPEGGLQLGLLWQF